MNKEILKDHIFSVVDLETSDLSPTKGEILEICILQVKNCKIIDTFETLVRPTRRVKLSSITVHGIDNDTLMMAPDKLFVVPKVIKMLHNTILVEHNLNNFDSGFLQIFLKESPWLRTMNTLSLARIIMPNLKSYSLRNLCSTFAINISEQHSARVDAEATAKLFIKLLEVCEKEQLFSDDIIKNIRG